LGNKIIRTTVVLIFSIVAAILIFLLLTYSGIILKFLHIAMPLFGLNPGEQGGDEKYVLYFIGGVIGILFIISFIVLNRYLFKKRK